MADVTTVPVPISPRERLRAVVGFFGLPCILFAAVLGAAGVLLAADPGNGGSVAAVLMIQTLTVPALFARRWPAWAAIALAIGALLNEIVIGPMVRCGVVLPVLFLIAYQFGSSGPALRRPMLVFGVTAWVGVAAMELAWDPVLDSSAAVIIAALGGGFFCAGMLIRSRTGMVRSLRLRTQELHAQRDRTAALEVAADRSRVGADLERLIRTQVQEILANADLARSAVDDEPARAALVAVEQSGRETLARMRDVVGGLRSNAPTAPPPGLDQLSDLLKRATTADARMTIRGRARPLTTNLELSAYRIIEQLLTTLHDHPRARVEVTIRFTDEALEILSSTTSECDFGRSWLLLSDGRRVIALSIDLRSPRMMPLADQEGAKSNILADYDLGAQMGKISLVEFVFGVGARDVDIAPGLFTAKAGRVRFNNTTAAFRVGVVTKSWEFHSI